MERETLPVASHDTSAPVEPGRALDSAGAVIYTIDRSFRIVAVNAGWDEFAAAHGAAHLQAPEIIGTNLLDWIDGARREETRTICEAIFQGKLRQYEYEYDCSSSEARRTCALLVSPLHDADGAIHGATFVSHDITRRKQLEAEVAARNAELQALADELRRQRAALEREREDARQLAQVADAHAAQLGTIIGAMADGVWMCDAAGVLWKVNAAGLEMFGLRYEQVVGQRIEELPRLFSICRGERRHLGLRLALQGQPIRAECELQLPNDGRILTVDISATPFRDESGAVIGAVSVVRDITQTKAMDRLKEDFLSVAAHELKTPLTALKGYTQLALRRIANLPELESARRSLKAINEQTDRITGLVQKLLDVSRIQEGRLVLQRSRFDLQDLITSVAEQTRVTAPGHDVQVMPHAPVVVSADFLRLEQVIFNLLDNAIKYSPDSGTIRINTQVDGDRVQVSVHDEGLGVPAEKLPHIFERWYQAHSGTHGDYGGMGLGLYICKEIVEQHGGQIWATSPGEGGTTVGFMLPLHATDSEQR